MAAPKAVPLEAVTLARAAGAKLKRAMAFLTEVAGGPEAAKSLAQQAEKVLGEKAQRLSVFRKAIPRSLSEIGRAALTRHLSLLTALAGDSDTARVVRAVLKTKEPAFAALLDRLPLVEFLDLIEKETPALKSAAKAGRAAVVKRIANGLNELAGVFHPEIIATFRKRAGVVTAAIKKSRAFQQQFKLLETEPSIIFSIRAAPVKGSEKASKLFVDARAVLRVRRVKDGKIMFVKLGDVQVKSTNVSELSDQFLSDALRDARGTDFAYRNRKSGPIPAGAFIDAAQAKLVKAGLINPYGAGHGSFNPSRVTKANSALTPKYVVHDVPLSVTERLAKLIGDAILGN